MPDPVIMPTHNSSSRTVVAPSEGAPVDTTYLVFKKIVREDELLWLYLETRQAAGRKEAIEAVVITENANGTYEEGDTYAATTERFFFEWTPKRKQHVTWE